MTLKGEERLGQKLQEIRMEDDLMVRQLNKITNARRTSILVKLGVSFY